MAEVDVVVSRRAVEKIMPADKVDAIVKRAAWRPPAKELVQIFLVGPIVERVITSSRFARSLALSAECSALRPRSGIRQRHTSGGRCRPGR